MNNLNFTLGTFIGCYFVSHNFGCTSIHRPLSYPLRSLMSGEFIDLLDLSHSLENTNMQTNIKRDKNRLKTCFENFKIHMYLNYINDFKFLNGANFFSKEKALSLT